MKCPKCGSETIFKASTVRGKIVDFGRFNGGKQYVYEKRYTCVKCGQKFDYSYS